MDGLELGERLAEHALVRDRNGVEHLRHGAAEDDAEGGAARRLVDVLLSLGARALEVAEPLGHHRHGRRAVHHDHDVLVRPAPEALEIELALEEHGGQHEGEERGRGGEQAPAPPRMVPEREADPETGDGEQRRRQDDDPRDARFRLDEGARERERRERGDQAAAREQKHVLQQHAAAAATHRVEQEAHCAPEDFVEVLSVQQVDDDGDRHRQQTEEHGCVDELHASRSGCQPAPMRRRTR